MTSTSHWVCRQPLLELLRARPDGKEEELKLLLDSVEAEQVALLDTFAAKTSLKPLGEPLKALVEALSCNEDVLDRMLRTYRRIQQSDETDISQFTKWFYSEQQALIRVNIVTASSSPYLYLWQRLEAKRVVEKAVAQLESLGKRAYLSDDDLLVLFALEEFVFHALHYHGGSWTEESAIRLASTSQSLVHVAYNSESQASIGHKVVDLATVIFIRLLDLESILLKRVPLIPKSRVDQLLTASSIDAGNSMQALAVSLHKTLSGLDGHGLGQRAYQAGVFYRILAICITFSADQLVKIVINQLLLAFLQAFDVGFVDLGLLVKCFVKLFDLSPPLADYFFLNLQAYKPLLHAISCHFPYVLNNVLPLMLTLSVHKPQEVFDYLSSLSEMCAERTADRGLVKESTHLDLQQLHLVTAKQFEIPSHSVGFYLPAGSKGICFLSQQASSIDADTEMSLVHWQLDYSGWHFLIRLLLVNASHMSIHYVLAIFRNILCHLEPHAKMSCPLFSDVITPPLPVLVYRCIMSNRLDSLIVSKGLALLCDIQDLSALSETFDANLLLSLFVSEEDISRLPVDFFQALHQASLIALMVGKTFDLSWEISFLLSAVPNISCISSLGCLCGAIFNLASSQRDLCNLEQALREFAQNCLRNSIAKEDAASYLLSSSRLEIKDATLVERLLYAISKPALLLNLFVCQANVPLTHDALSKLGELACQQMDLLEAITERHPQTLCTLASETKFPSTLVSIVDIESQLASFLLKWWSDCKRFLPVRDALRGQAAFWPAINRAIGKFSGSSQCSLIEVLALECAMNPEFAGNEELADMVVPVDNPELARAAMMLLSSAMIRDRENQRKIVEKAITYTKHFPLEPFEGVIRIIERYAPLFKVDEWESLANVFVERLTHGDKDGAESFFHSCPELSLSSGLHAISLSVHLNLPRLCMILVKKLLPRSDSDQVIFVVQRDRILASDFLADKAFEDDIADCAIKCTGFADAVFAAGYLYKRSSVRLMTAVAFHGLHIESLMALLNSAVLMDLQDLSLIDQHAWQLFPLLVRYAVRDSPVTHAFVHRLVPLLFATLRRNVDVEERTRDSKQLLSLLWNNRLIDQALIQHGMDAMDPPIPYRSILRKLEIELS
jgi:hypothetical protein